jgi:hypothetical protein
LKGKRFVNEFNLERNILKQLNQLEETFASANSQLCSITGEDSESPDYEVKAFQRFVRHSPSEARTILKDSAEFIRALSEKYSLSSAETRHGKAIARDLARVAGKR